MPLPVQLADGRDDGGRIPSSLLVGSEPPPCATVMMANCAPPIADPPPTQARLKLAPADAVDIQLTCLRVRGGPKSWGGRGGGGARSEMHGRGVRSIVVLRKTLNTIGRGGPEALLLQEAQSHAVSVSVSLAASASGELLVVGCAASQGSTSWCPATRVCCVHVPRPGPSCRCGSSQRGPTRDRRDESPHARHRHHPLPPPLVDRLWLGDYMCATVLFLVEDAREHVGRGGRDRVKDGLDLAVALDGNVGEQVRDPGWRVRV